jgi:hypothetical protein
MQAPSNHLHIGVSSNPFQRVRYHNTHRQRARRGGTATRKLAWTLVLVAGPFLSGSHEFAEHVRSLVRRTHGLDKAFYRVWQTTQKVNKGVRLFAKDKQRIEKFFTKNVM